jgi:WD40 repeat protein
MPPARPTGWLRSRLPALVVLVLLLAVVVSLTLRGTGHPRSQVLTREHRYAVGALAFARDGNALAVGGGLLDRAAELTVWDLTADRERTLCSGPGASVESLTFDPDGTTLATMHYDGAVRLWDAATGRERAARRDPASGVWGALSPDGRAAAWPGLDQTLRVWDLPAGRLRAVLPVRASRCLGWAPDGRTLAVEPEFGSREVRLCDPETGAVQVTLRRSAPPGLGAAFSADGRRLAVGGNDGTVEVWDRRTGRPVCSWQGHPRLVCAVALSPDGTALA